MFRYTYKKLLIDQVGWHDDTKRLFHVYWKEQGGLLAHVQHGGVYEGTSNHLVSDGFEFDADYFFTWGWSQKKEAQRNLIPVPSFYMSRIFNKHQKANDHIIFVSSLAATSYDGIVYPEPCDAIDYMKSKIKFLNTLNKLILDRIYYRDFPVSSTAYLSNLNYLKSKGFILKKQQGFLFFNIQKSLY